MTNVHERRLLKQGGNGKCTEVKGLEATCLCRMVQVQHSNSEIYSTKPISFRNSESLNLLLNLFINLSDASYSACVKMYSTFNITFQMLVTFLSNIHNTILVPERYFLIISRILPNLVYLSLGIWQVCTYTSTEQTWSQDHKLAAFQFEQIIYVYTHSWFILFHSAIMSLKVLFLSKNLINAYGKIVTSIKYFN